MRLVKQENGWRIEGNGKERARIAYATLCDDRLIYSVEGATSPNDARPDLAEADSSLRVIEIDPQTDARWEALLAELPESHIYHHSGWLQVLQEAYGYRPVNLACEDAHGRLRGVFPLFYHRGLLTGRRFTSLPRTPVGGPIACDNAGIAALVHAAIERSRNEKDGQLQVKMMSNTLDGLVEGLIGLPWRETYVLRLPDHPDQLRIGNSQNRARIKWAVNKAARKGVEVHPASSERELRDWYAIYLNTMRGIAIPPRPYRFFEVAWRRLQPRGFLRLLLARKSVAGQSKIVAGSLFTMFGQRVFYAFTGWKSEYTSSRANDAIQWRAIRDACAEGFRYYDFGEVSRNNTGLAQFKSSWGGERQWLYRYYYPTPRESETRILDSDGRMFQLRRTAWQLLPIRATVLLSELGHYYF
jgi:hypothetical protein